MVDLEKLVKLKKDSQPAVVRLIKISYSGLWSVHDNLGIVAL